MKKIVFAFVATGLFILSPLMVSAAEVPHAPTYTISSASIGSSTGIPLYIYIPSLKLFTYIQGVGVTPDGKMDVPSGKTNNVGWYQYGPTPGEVGTAVIDAHNTAAFKTLNKLPVGGDIYVFVSSGKWLHFSVTKERTYPVATTPSTVLFASANKPQINLITCAGTLLGNGQATHRLIVSAELL